MTRIRWHPAAHLEAREAAGYYAARRTGGGARFTRRLRSAIELIRTWPAAGSPYEESTRRILLQVYPYSVVYLEAPGQVEIVAVMHFRREPGYWKGRLPLQG